MKRMTTLIITCCMSLHLLAQEGISGSVYVSEAGTLYQLLQDAGLMDAEQLSVSGYLNGEDIRILRSRMGGFFWFNIEEPEDGYPARSFTLKSLNLEDAHIVEGGGPYVFMQDEDPTNRDLWPHTANDVLGRQMFHSCFSLRSIILPKDITQIEESCFENCFVKYLRIPESVNFIGLNAFTDCQNYPSGDYPFGDNCLHELILPDNSGLRIASGAFCWCRRLSTVYCLSAVPYEIIPTWTGNAIGFNNGILGTVKLVVPKGSAQLYAAAPGWKEVANIVESDDIVTDAAAKEAEWKLTVIPSTIQAPMEQSGQQSFYTVSGIRHNSRVHGLNIVHDSDGSVRKVFVR